MKRLSIVFITVVTALLVSCVWRPKVRVVNTYNVPPTNEISQSWGADASNFCTAYNLHINDTVFNVGTIPTGDSTEWQAVKQDLKTETVIIRAELTGTRSGMQTNYFVTNIVFKRLKSWRRYQYDLRTDRLQTYLLLP